MSNVTTVNGSSASKDIFQLENDAGLFSGGRYVGNSIPIFYVDSYTVSSDLGLSYVSGPGVTVLTSYQEDMPIRPDTHIPAPGYPGYYYDVSAVTQADIPFGWLASAEVVAHEIGHNLGLQHVNFADLMYPYAALYNEQSEAAYYLNASQVSTMLQSPLVQKQGNLYSIDIIPYSVLSSLPVLSGVPEPATWAMFIGGFALAGGAMRRRKVGVRFG